MKTPTLTCRDDRRRHQVRRRHFNGLDYLEVSDDQLRLTVYFLGPAPEGITPANVRIRGGRRIRDVEVVDVKTCPQVDPELDNCLVVTVDKPGDFSTYTLCLVDLPPETCFDPRYLCLDFTFKANCPTDLDCKSAPRCPPEVLPEPEISYLAKDYASFRRLILDRLAVVLPDWQERHVPDLGVTLVELLAYAGDYLSYTQDAVATEAYLDTARQRISVRRHARLVDYFVHEGSNARAWIHVHTSTDVAVPVAELSFLTGFDEAPEVEDRVLRWLDLEGVPGRRFEVFEPLVEAPGGEVELFSAHNRIRIYTWGDAECCLARGATSATLVDGAARPPRDEDGDGYGEDDGDGDGDGYGDDDGDGYEVVVAKRQRGAKRARDEKRHRGKQPQGGKRPYAGKQRDGYAEPDDEEGCEDVPPAEDPYQRVLHLEPGDFLVFEEVVGPKTADPAAADPGRRHVVRLTRAEPIVDELYGQPLLDVAWAVEDALPFPLCLSTIGPPPDCALIEDVSVARGNLLLADHGRRLDPEDLGCVPVEDDEAVCEGEGRPAEVVRRPGRFRPILGEGPLTFSQPLPPAAPAAVLIDQDPRQALPWIRLTSRPDPRCEAEPAEESPDGDRDEAPLAWTARRDLLASDAGDLDYVVEMDDRRLAHLRFGDGELGRRPDGGLAFAARYRVGNGPAGNVGADTVMLAVTESLLSGVTLSPRNPLPARGGTAPEPVAEVKLFAPHAFRRELARAVTPADYAELAGRHTAVQRAAAELCWNGSWYEVRVAVDPLGRAEADAGLLAEIETGLYRFRRIGHDLAVRPARYVPLDLVLRVCVGSRFLRGHVKAALLERFSSRCLPDGSLGCFHPDAVSFGDDVSLSRLVAAAQAVPGVESVTVAKLERLFEGPDGELEEGLLPIGPLEIARLDNDPSFPENGRIRFDLGGGR
jgi:hypothetical protein